jgi:amidohydrolase
MPTELLDALLNELDHELPGALELRRAIHTAPDLAHHEHATSRAIAGALDVEVATAAGTGVIARAGRSERVVAVRAELDGLPLEEHTGADYASRNGAMHACGHDVHAAALVALARAARRLEEHLPAQLMAVFQPSEEDYPSGAQLLVDEGVFARSVAGIVGVHLHPDLPWGSLSIGLGPINAACDNIEIAVEGRSAHAAYPQIGRDPILAISSIVVGLHTLVSRRVDPLHPAVLTVGQVHGGKTPNTIPATATASLTLRTYFAADRASLREAIRELAESTARAHGCRARVETTEGEPVLRNDPRIIARAQALAPGAGFELAEPWRSCGSDDFAFFGAVAPIAMAFAGLSGAPGFALRPLHHPEFLPPDEAVAAVARAQAVLFLAAAQP